MSATQPESSLKSHLERSSHKKKKKKLLGLLSHEKQKSPKDEDHILPKQKKKRKKKKKLLRIIDQNSPVVWTPLSELKSSKKKMGKQLGKFSKTVEDKCGSDHHEDSNKSIPKMHEQSKKVRANEQASNDSKKFKMEEKSLDETQITEEHVLSSSLKKKKKKKKKKKEDLGNDMSGNIEPQFFSSTINEGIKKVETPSASPIIRPSESSVMKKNASENGEKSQESHDEVHSQDSNDGREKKKKKKKRKKGKGDDELSYELPDSQEKEQIKKMAKHLRFEVSDQCEETPSKRFKQDEGLHSTSNKPQSEKIISKELKSSTYQHISLMTDLQRQIQLHGIFEVFKQMPDADLGEVPEHEKMISGENCMSYVFGRPNFKVLESDHESVTIKVMTYILKEDISLTKLNMIHDNRTWYLPRKISEKILLEIPEFKTGSFSDQEDIIILSRLKALVEKLSLNEEDLYTMAAELVEYPRKGHLFICKLILGAFLGRPLLRYRRAFDIFTRFLRMLNRSRKMSSEKQQMILDFLNEKKSEINENFRKKHTSKEEIKALRNKVNDPGVNVATLHDMNQKLNQNGSKLNRGRWSEEEYLTVIKYAMRSYKCEVMNMKLLAQDFQNLEREINRSAKKIHALWHERIWPTLAMHEKGENFSSNDWKIDVLIAIRNEERFKEIKDINWKYLAKHFPCQTNWSLRKMFDNDVILPSAQKKIPWREGLDIAIEKLRSNPTKKLKDHENIIDIYESEKQIQNRGQI